MAHDSNTDAYHDDELHPSHSAVTTTSSTTTPAATAAATARRSKVTTTNYSSIMNHHNDQFPEMEPFLLPPLPVAEESTLNDTHASLQRLTENPTESSSCDSSDTSKTSFLRAFLCTNGPPQIILLCILFAFGFGCTIGVVPAVMTNRYAVLLHNSTGPDCSSYSTTRSSVAAHNGSGGGDGNNTNIKPPACYDASADAQNGVAMEEMISNTFTFLTSSYIGSISDMYGRKPIMILGLFINSLSPLFLVLIQLDPYMSPFYYYSIGTLSGLVSWIGVALSTLSDVMPSHWRAPSYGLVLVGFSLGFAMAPQLAFFLGHWYVSLLSLGTIWLGIIFLIFCLPETLSPNIASEAKRVRQEQIQQQTSTSTQRILYNVFYRPFWELSILNRNRLFRLLSCLAFFSGMVSSGDRTLLVYYIEERLNFNDKDIATMFLLIGLLGIFIQGFVLKLFNDKCGERYVVMFAFLFGALNNVIYAMASNKATIYVGIAVGSFVGMSFPTISAIKSNNVDASEQGRIQGALYSLSALASAFGPVAMRTVYQYTKDGALYGPGTMFLFAAGLYCFAVYCAYLLPTDADSRKANHNDTGTAFSPEENGNHSDINGINGNDEPVSATTPLLQEIL